MRVDIGLLILRLGIGGLMLPHGLSKLGRFSELSTKFADPIGIGHTGSLLLTLFAEVGCTILLMIGLKTRLAAVPLAIMMLVITFAIHGGDPWAKQELALLYFVPFLALAFTGAGRFSLDQIFFRK